MSRSTKKPYIHYASFDPKTQRAFRNLSRRLIRRKGRQCIKDCMKVRDLEDAEDIYHKGTSFKDGYDEYRLPSDGHQHYYRIYNTQPLGYLTKEELEEDRKKSMRK